MLRFIFDHSLKEWLTGMKRGRQKYKKSNVKNKKKCTIKMPALHCFDVFLVNFELFLFILGFLGKVENLKSQMFVSVNGTNKISNYFI